MLGMKPGLPHARQVYSISEQPPWPSIISNFFFFFFGSMFRITSDGVHGILCNAREQAWVSCAEGNHLTYCSILSRRIINKFKRVVKNFLYCGNAENINFN